MILLVAITIGLVLITVVVVLARKARIEDESLKREVCALTIDRAKELWLERARSTRDWHLDLGSRGVDDLRPLLLKGARIEYVPAKLYVGTCDFQAPEGITKHFQVIGVIGADDPAWICCRHDNDKVWELDSTETAADIRRSEFPSLFHYFLFTHRYYEEGPQTTKKGRLKQSTRA